MSPLPSRNIYNSGRFEIFVPDKNKGRWPPWLAVAGWGKLGDGALNSHFDLSKHKQLLLYPSRLSEGGLLSAARQRILLYRNRHKMDMIAHQTRVPPANGVALAILTQQLQVDHTVLL